MSELLSADDPGRAWRAIAAMEGPGYHYEFTAAAIVALQRGLRLEAHLQAHPAIASLPELAPLLGRPVVAACDEQGPLVTVDGALWLRGDAFDMGREFYALVGFNEAPFAAHEALVAQGGAALAAAVDRLALTYPEET